MGVVTRFFGPSPSGLANGLTWGDRAALLPSGAWNTLITGHAFNGADSLRCIVEAATYAVPALSYSSGAPSVANRLSFMPGTALGIWQPPNPAWNCCQSMWDQTGMLTFTSTANFSGGRFVDLYGVRVRASAGTTSFSSGFANWCDIQSSFASGSGYAGYSSELTNCWIQHTAATYAAVYYFDTTQMLNNVRIVANPAAVSGNRHGLGLGFVQSKFANLCIVGALVGISGVTGNLGTGVEGCTFVDCTTAILDRSTSTTFSGQYTRNLFHNCTTGISLTDLTKTRPIVNNIFNSVATMQSGNGNWDNTGLNTVSSLAAADLFVDPDNGDYRIKYGSPHWGKGIGAGDGPIPPAAIAEAIWTRAGRSLS
jgi:hypothetical protein